MNNLKQLLADESALLSAKALQAIKGGNTGGPPILWDDEPPP